MRQGLRQGGLQWVVSPLIFNPPLKGLPLLLLLLGQGFQLSRITRREREDLGDVYANNMCAIESAHLGGDDRTPIHALCAITVILQAAHQLGPGARYAVAIPA